MREISGSNNMQQRFSESVIWRPFMKLPGTRSSSAVILILLFLLVGAFFCTRLLDSTEITDSSAVKPLLSSRIPKTPIEIPLNCTAFDLTRKCPTNYPTTIREDIGRPPSTCPEFFRWIHEDLRPWARTGITRDIVERAKRTANFRLVIVNGKAYFERYIKGFQTRDTYTLWGILQLLRRYPGKLPDLDMMFDCVDWPVVKISEYSGPNAATPPALFRYCGDDASLDIVFPDWSFWGWPEVNIKPWGLLSNDLKHGNKKTKWMEREPYAYWKGNPSVAETRQDLMKCNVSEKMDWNARVYSQDWGRESQQGYKQSNLANQCIHKYKIYIEGSAWSVSEKYILACDSVTLLVKPHYYDFFTRSLVPKRHYWPIKEDDKCRSIKFAVEWGNSHNQEAQEIGKAASEFIQEDLKMDNVYDYMFHVLNEYAKLLTYKPTIPPKAIELCSEAMACAANGLEKKFMMDSLVMGPADASPCTMPPPYDPASLHAILSRNRDSMKRIESWEKEYWVKQNKKS